MIAFQLKCRTQTAASFSAWADISCIRSIRVFEFSLIILLGSLTIRVIKNCTIMGFNFLASQVSHLVISSPGCAQFCSIHCGLEFSKNFSSVGGRHWRR